MFPISRGRWHLHHEAFDNHAERLGSVRVIHQREGDTIQQTYTPQGVPADHPLAALIGEASHRLTRGEGLITFDSHDFTGTACPQGQTLTQFRGLMTRFGLHVRSDLFTPDPDLVLGLTTLTTALHPVASLLTVGQRADDDHTPLPAFDGPRWSSAVAPRWAGTLETLSPDAAPHIETLKRRAGGLRVEEHAHDEAGTARKVITWELETWAPHAIVSGTVRGLAHIMGHLTRIEAVSGPHTHLELIEIVHPASGWLVGARHWYTDQALHRTEVITLRPA